MKAKITQEKLLNALQSVAVIVDEPTFKFTKDGVFVCDMDPSRVAMVDWALNKEAFDEYSVEDVEEKVTIHLSELLKIIRRAGKEDTIELSESVGSKLQVDIRGSYRRTFTLPILEATTDETPTPKVTFNAEAKLTAEGFANAIADANMVSDHTRIIVDVGKVDLIAEGDLMGAEVNLKESDNVLLAATIKETAKATFSLSYLSEMMKAAKYAEIVTLHLSTDMPLKLSIDTETPGKLDYWLAPRIEVE